MADYTVSTAPNQWTLEASQAALDAGLTAARTLHNDQLEPVMDEFTGLVIDPNPNLKATNQDYVQFVMSRAFLSYARNFGTIPQ